MNILIITLPLMGKTTYTKRFKTLKPKHIGYVVDNDPKVNVFGSVDSIHEKLARACAKEFSHIVSGDDKLNLIFGFNSSCMDDLISYSDEVIFLVPNFDRDEAVTRELGRAYHVSRDQLQSMHALEIVELMYRDPFAVRVANEWDLWKRDLLRKAKMYYKNEEYNPTGQRIFLMRGKSVEHAIAFISEHTGHLKEWRDYVRDRQIALKAMSSTYLFKGMMGDDYMISANVMDVANNITGDPSPVELQIHSHEQAGMSVTGNPFHRTTPMTQSFLEVLRQNYVFGPWRSSMNKVVGGDDCQPQLEENGIPQFDK